MPPSDLTRSSLTHHELNHTGSSFKCYDCVDDECFEPGYCETAVSCFEFRDFDSKVVFGLKKGCFTEVGNAHLSCNATRLRSPGKALNRKRTLHCCTGHLCNNKALVQDLSHKKFVNSHPEVSTDSWNPTNVTQNSASILSNELIIIASLGILAILLAIILLASRITKRRSGRSNNTDKPTICGLIRPVVEKSSKETYYDETITSGSGSGGPLLSDRTFCREIKLHEVLYKGRKTEVWKGIWNDMDVAVKIFYSRDEEIWMRERDLYLKINEGGRFILKLYGADMTSINECTEFWLVTHHCNFGSLYDFLMVNTVSYYQCLSLILTALYGINSLHQELRSCRIAHRDIKSKNILLLNSTTACIADFGLAVSDDEDLLQYSSASKYKVGTKRYMAPELLEEKFEYNNFESYQKIDIYSFALVMWEVVRRIDSFEIQADDYSLPYGGIVPSDPSFSDMKKVVCDDQQRPWISKSLSNDKIASKICNMMSDAWDTNPYQRPTASHMIKLLEKIQKDFTESNSKDFQRY